MIFKVKNWTAYDKDNPHYVICCEKPEYSILKMQRFNILIFGRSCINTYFIWKDGTVHHNSTGWIADDCNYGKTLGFWVTQKEAEIFLAGWKVLNPTPKPDLSAVDYEPEYELGTLYKDSVGITFQYVKLDFGVTARDSNQKKYNYIQYRWFCMKG